MPESESLTKSCGRWNRGATNEAITLLPNTGWNQWVWSALRSKLGRWDGVISMRWLTVDRLKNGWNRDCEDVRA